MAYKETLRQVAATMIILFWGAIVLGFSFGMTALPFALDLELGFKQSTHDALVLFWEIGFGVGPIALYSVVFAPGIWTRTMLCGRLPIAQQTIPSRFSATPTVDCPAPNGPMPSMSLTPTLDSPAPRSMRHEMMLPAEMLIEVQEAISSAVLSGTRHRSTYALASASVSGENPGRVPRELRVMDIPSMTRTIPGILGLENAPEPIRMPKAKTLLGFPALDGDVASAPPPAAMRSGPAVVTTPMIAVVAEPRTRTLAAHQENARWLLPQLIDAAKFRPWDVTIRPMLARQQSDDGPTLEVFSLPYNEHDPHHQLIMGMLAAN